MKKLAVLLLLIIVNFASSGHVGSPGVQMQGQAGSYKVLVNVQPPAVIPGTAKITVFVESGTAAQVFARPIYFRSGSRGAPSPDEMTPVAEQNAQFQGEIWLMERGSSSVQLEISGDKGKGEIIVPVIAVSTQKETMPKGLGIGLGMLGLLLLLLMVTTIGASVSDALLPAGKNLTSAQKSSRWKQMGISTAICLLILYGGSRWWDSWAAEYTQYIYKPLKGNAIVTSSDSLPVFQLKIDTSNWAFQRKGSMLSTLIPDHGKLMHVFLVRTPGLDAFAHIHPERRDSTTFESFLPNLPAGKYLVYADVLNYSGFADTITDTLLISGENSKTNETKKTAEEDTYILTDPLNAPGVIPADENVVICGKPGTKTVFKDGSYAIWEGKPDKALEAGKPYELNFEIFNPDGSPCIPEPYLGMLGHVAVLRSDGSVYIHLHPTGSYAMASGKIFSNRLADTAKFAKKPSPAFFRDSIDRHMAKLKAMPMMEREQFLMTEMGMHEANQSGSMSMEHGNRISFPYSFPKDGRYRIFLQIRRNEQILSGAFDVRVKETVF